MKSGLRMIVIGLVLGAVSAISETTSRGRTGFSAAPFTPAQCTPNGDCHTAPAWELNIPPFIEVDLKNKAVETTKASGENRASPISNMISRGRSDRLPGCAETGEPGAS